MKKVVFALVLVPFILLAQESPPEPLFVNIMLTPNPTKISEFEAGLSSYNKKFHTEGANGARVYWIASGENTGKYVWVMGPTAWSVLDGNPDSGNDQMNDWNTKVAPYADPKMDMTYWKGDAKRSNFTKNFTIKNMAIFYLDIKRFQNQKFLPILDKITKVFKIKDADQQWGVYWNQLPNKTGQDMVWINFFDSMSWMDQDDRFAQWYEEIHGEGSFMSFLKDFEATTNKDWQELWIFRPDLSGLSGDVAIPSED